MAATSQWFEGWWSDAEWGEGPSGQPLPFPRTESGGGTGPKPGDTCANEDPTCGHARSKHDPECEDCACTAFVEPD